MIKTAGAFLTLTLMVLAAPAWSQTAGAPVATAQGEVTAFPPAFFAPYSPVTAGDLVGRIPGFDVDGGSNARGLSGAAGNVLIDGQRPPGKTSIWDALSRIRAEQVERIDLIQGGAPGIDMLGKQRVINIILLPQKGGSSYAVEAGAVYVPTADRYDGDFKLSGVRELANGARFDAELSYDRAIGEASTPGGTRIRRNLAGDIITDVSSLSDDSDAELSGEASAQFPLLGGQARVTGQLERSTDSRRSTEWFNGVPRLSENNGERREGEAEASYDRALPGGGAVQAVLSTDWSERQSQSRSLSGRPPTGFTGEEAGGRLDASVDYPLREGLRLQTILAHSWNEESSTSSSLRGGGGVSNETDQEQTGETALRSTVFFDPRPGLAFEAGAEGAYNFLEGESEISLGGVAVPIPGSQAKVDEQRGEVFTIARWQVDPAVELQGALRYEFSTLTATGLEKNLGFVKPMIQARWDLNADRQLTARVERTVGQLNFGDFLSSASISEFDEFIRAGATDLTPTQTWISSLRFNQQFWETGALEMRVDYRALSDIIDRVPVVTATRVFEATGNIGDGRQSNFNLEVDAPLDRLGVPGARLSFDANILLLSEMTDPFTAEERRFAWDTDHRFSVDFEHDLPQWNTTWGFSASTQATRYSYRRDSLEISDQTPNLSAYAIYRPDEASTLRFDLRNIGPGYSENRRDVYLGLREVTPLDYIEYRRNERATSLRVTYRREQN